jgi:hypothetical protein
MKHEPLPPLVLDPAVIEAVEKACAAWLAKQKP